MSTVTESQNITFVGGKRHSGMTLAETVYSLIGGKMTVSARPVPGEVEDFVVEGVRPDLKVGDFESEVNRFYAERGYTIDYGSRAGEGLYCFGKPNNSRQMNVSFTLSSRVRRLLGTVQTI